MNFSHFHPHARAEFLEAVIFLENESSGLGTEFMLEFDDALHLIHKFPNTWNTVKGEIRRFILSRFSYSIVYKIEKKKLAIIAVMHHSRKPLYWAERVSDK
ncbi:MAG: hypothetical protein A2017_17990 [Lentisphaerae bacterium GWF2_44_16]|nr:MAG: hypothetical protein A2017_17990 [Lentisphaerae bacterium GWF2_44_16]